MDFLIVIAVVVVVLVPVIGYSFYADRRRREELQKIAEELGLEYYVQGSPDLINQLGQLKLLSTGRSRKLTKLIQGESDEVVISIFDYKYTTGSGKQSQTHYQTVAALQSPQLEITDFALRPETMFDKIGGMIGYQDIDFDSHPNFSKMFVLKGMNEAAVRALFKPAILAYFEDKKGISVEAVHGAIIIYRPGRYVKPPEIKGFLGEAYEVYGVFVDNP